MSLHPISGYEGFYSVEDDGRIFSHYMGTFMKPKTGAKGYKSVGLHKDGKTKNHYVHRLVMHVLKGMDINDSRDVDHIDRDRANNHPLNLRVLTRSDNLLHGKGRLSVDTETHKGCRKCGDLLPRNYFGINNASLDRLNSICKPCNRAQTNAFNERYWADRVSTNQIGA